MTSFSRAVRSIPSRAGQWLRRLVHVAMLGSVLFSGSELLFWTAARPLASAPELAVTWIAFCFATYAFMIVLQLGRVVERHGLFLAGAIYGWLVEGCIESTMFDVFPLHLAWTSLAWHASFAVLVCVWYLRSGATAWSWPRYLLLLGAVGAAYGLWSVFWVLEGVVRPDPLDFLGRSCLIAVPLLLGHGLLGRISGTWQASRLEMAIVLGGFCLLFLLKLASVGDTVMLSFPVLIAITGLAIARLRRRHAGEEDMLTRLGRPMPWSRLLALPLLPLVGTAVYAPFWALDAAIQTNIAVLVVSVTAGVWLYGQALFVGFSSAARD